MGSWVGPGIRGVRHLDAVEVDLVAHVATPALDKEDVNCADMVLVLDPTFEKNFFSV